MDVDTNQGGLSTALAKLTLKDTFLVPELNLPPKHIEPNSAGPEEYVQNVMHNIRAEYSAFAKNTTPTVFLADRLKLGSADNTEIIISELLEFPSLNVLPTSSTESLNTHLFVMDSTIFLARTRASGTDDRPPYLECIESGEWSVPNANFDKLKSTVFLIRPRLREYMIRDDLVVCERIHLLSSIVSRIMYCCSCCTHFIELFSRGGEEQSCKWWIGTRICRCI